MGPYLIVVGDPFGDEAAGVNAGVKLGHGAAHGAAQSAITSNMIDGRRRAYRVANFVGIRILTTRMLDAHRILHYMRT